MKNASVQQVPVPPKKGWLSHKPPQGKCPGCRNKFKVFRWQSIAWEQSLFSKTLLPQLTGVYNSKDRIIFFPPHLFQSSLLDFVAAQTQQSSALRRTIKPAKLMQKKKKLNTHTQHTQNHSGRHGHMEVFNKYVHVALGDTV